MASFGTARGRQLRLPVGVGRAAALLLLAVLPGCTYLTAVTKDLGESFQLGLGASFRPGIKVSARVSVFAVHAAWLRDGWYVGNDHGYAFWWREHSFGFPAVYGTLDRWRGEGSPPGVQGDPAGYVDADVYCVIFVPHTDSRLDRLSNEMRVVVLATQVDVGVHLLVVGATLGINVAQLLDFLTGLATVDLLGDDPSPRVRSDG